MEPKPIPKSTLFVTYADENEKVLVKVTDLEQIKMSKIIFAR